MMLLAQLPNSQPATACGRSLFLIKGAKEKVSSEFTMQKLGNKRLAGVFYKNLF